MVNAPGAGALEYESDGYVPTGKRKQGAFGAGVPSKEIRIFIKMTAKNVKEITYMP